MSPARSIALTAALCLGATLAQAAPLPATLQISAKVSVDTVNSAAAVSAAQSGTLSIIQGAAAPVTSSFSGDPATLAPSLLSGTLTEIGDGIGARFSMSGVSTGGTATAGPLFADFLVELDNTSATDTYTVIFRALASNGVSAAGADAYAHSDVSVRDAALTELFFSDYFADTVNAGNNFTLASLTNTFSIVLAPGASASFTALQRQVGGVYAAGNFSASLDTFLRLDDVRSSGGTPVPLPGSLPLLALGLALLACTRRASPR